ncbi:2860_t:CDS:2, partial [Funneliformis mosseae]
LLYTASIPRWASDISLYKLNKSTSTYSCVITLFNTSLVEVSQFPKICDVFGACNSSILERCVDSTTTAMPND